MASSWKAYKPLTLLKFSDSTSLSLMGLDRLIVAQTLLLPVKCIPLNLFHTHFPSILLHSFCFNLKLSKVPRLIDGSLLQHTIALFRVAKSLSHLEWLEGFSVWIPSRNILPLSKVFVAKFLSESFYLDASIRRSQFQNDLLKLKA